MILLIMNENIWSEIDNVGINILKQNFDQNTKKKRFFKTGRPWGYSFKDELYEHTFKIIDSPTYDNKVPGKIIGNKGVKPITLLKQYSESFKKSFDKYKNDLVERINQKIIDDVDRESFNKSIEGKDNEQIIKIILANYRKYNVNDETKEEKDKREKLGLKKKSSLISKDFIKLLFEFSLRANFDFLKYDLFLLKYIS